MKYTPQETDYHPSSISFLEGFLGPRGDVGYFGYFMVADFEMAKDIINELILTGRDVDFAEMGLDGDWEVCSQTIFEEGSFVEDYAVHCRSQWAPTVLIVYFTDGPNEMFPVWNRQEKQK